MTDKVISVTGCGAIHVVPDVTRLQLTLQSLHDTYEEAYEQAKTNTEKLSSIMTIVELNSKLPKTTKLDINQKNKDEYDRNNNFTGTKFLGYTLDHRVKIDIATDNVLLNKIVTHIGQLLKQAEIEIGYTVADPRPSQLKMLERAVKDAKEKAQIMAEACGCKLGLVKNIDYTEREVKVYVQARQIHEAEEAASCNAESLDITPSDLVVSDTVVVEWFLSNDINKGENE